jgi:sterol desaturase/sphingolipid hydroxylase (fatty acid hydroxylase superfamily)
MKTELYLILAVFWGLILYTLADAAKRGRMFSRTQGAWLVDLIGLGMHGALVPLFQTLVVFSAMALFFPQLKGSLALSPVVSFCLSFVLIDYVYYWNHRLLHTPGLWRFN